MLKQLARLLQKLARFLWQYLFNLVVIFILTKVQ